MIRIRYDRTEEEEFVAFEDAVKEYRIPKFRKTNQSTTIDLRPICNKGNERSRYRCDLCGRHVHKLDLRRRDDGEVGIATRLDSGADAVCRLSAPAVFRVSVPASRCATCITPTTGVFVL